MENNEIVFDSSSGISVEEQKEILDKINGITEKNRTMLSQVVVLQPDKKSGKTPVINAKKSGAFLPLAVNIAAVVVLCAGAAFLVSFYSDVDARVRTGDAVYNLTEKALIEEIREETAKKIAEKDREISAISSRLQEVDAQLLQLYSGNEELTAEQKAAQERLFEVQNSYREELSSLQDERSRILEDARSREAVLRAQLEQRIRELTSSGQIVSGNLDSAMSELERLSSEQEKIAAYDAHLSGGLASVSALVEAGQYEQAAGVIDSLKQFCANNSLSTVRSFQAKREMYMQSINSMDTIVDEMRKFQDVNSEGWELYEKNAKLEESVAEMQKTIDAFSAGSSGQTRRLTELEENVSTLRASVSSLETSAGEKDRTISSLETERATLNRTVTDLQSTNASQAQEIASLRNQIEVIRQALLE